MRSALVGPTSSSIQAVHQFPYIHRDISWLQFNERVLTEAQLDTNPLLERTKFLAISSSNLDEFFMIRYASLARSIHNASRSDKAHALRLIRIRNSILEAVHRFSLKQSSILNTLLFELAEFNINLFRPNTADHRILELAQEIFRDQILPNLAPPEQFNPMKISTLENFQMSLIFRNEIWMRIPRNFPSFFSHWDSSSQTLFGFLLDDLLLQNIGPSFRIEGDPILIRMTRDGDFTADINEEDTESIPDMVRLSVGHREKGKPVRLQYRGKAKKDLLNSLMKVTKLSAAQLILTPGSLCMHGVASIKNRLPEPVVSQSQLSYPPLIPIIPKPFRDPQGIFRQLDSRDLLLHHPYDSFDAFVSWIQAACSDPEVTQIDQTIYRMDALSPIIEALKFAAKKKRIRVLIELRARFDELNNLRLADELRKAGVEVAFGFGKLKLHGKVALITRKHKGTFRRYAHLSTGNYNATTARQYTDLSILTSQPEICEDVHKFFESVWEGKIPTEFKHLVSAPTKLHRRLLSYIHGETEAAKKGLKARIVAKVNALVDYTVIQHLYEASQAGVHIDLIVRGACSLLPGVKGLSENIRVISVVDRFLEHSRIYYFSNAKRIYLSSADWMPRNFFSRLELAFPVLDPDIYRYLERFIIPVYLSDTMKARELASDGKWRRRRLSVSKLDTAASHLLLAGEKAVRSQFLLEKAASQEYEGTPLWKRSYGAA
jgi:polyphosphate kinase